MVYPTRLPLDVWEVLADLIDNHEATLKNLSAVCSSLVPLCQTRLFHTVILRASVFGANKTSSSRQRLAAVLRNAPDLALHIMHLRINGNLDYSNFREFYEEEEEALCFILSKVTNLKSLILEDIWPYVPWSRMTHKLKQSFFSLFLLPNLTHVELDGISGIPYSFFTHLKHVKTLYLHGISFVSLPDEQFTDQDIGCQPETLGLTIMPCFPETIYFLTPFPESTSSPLPLQLNHLRKLMLDISSRKAPKCHIWRILEVLSHSIRHLELCPWIYGWPRRSPNSNTDFEHSGWPQGSPNANPNLNQLVVLEEFSLVLRSQQILLLRKDSGRAVTSILDSLLTTTPDSNPSPLKRFTLYLESDTYTRSVFLLKPLWEKVDVCFADPCMGGLERVSVVLFGVEAGKGSHKERVGTFDLEATVRAQLPLVWERGVLKVESVSWRPAVVSYTGEPVEMD